jgi:hypothetical protein
VLLHVVGCGLQAGVWMHEGGWWCGGVGGAACGGRGGGGGGVRGVGV